MLCGPHTAVEDQLLRVLMGVNDLLCFPGRDWVDLSVGHGHLAEGTPSLLDSYWPAGSFPAILSV